MKRPTLVPAIALVGGLTVAYERWLKPWHQRWGATAEEVALALPATRMYDHPQSK